jgi:hypothetical protein
MTMRRSADSRSYSDAELVARLRALGRRPASRLADVLERALAPDQGAERLLEEIRSDALAVGEDPDKLFPTSPTALLAFLREAALSELNESGGK